MMVRYYKCLAIYITHFGSEIVDEKNIAIDDESGVKEFIVKHKGERLVNTWVCKMAVDI